MEELLNGSGDFERWTEAPIKMKLDGLLDMAGKAASKVLDKDGDGKVTMSDISQGMKDAAEQNLIPANMKPLYDSLNECVEAATKFTKAREDLDTASGSLQELLHLFDKIPPGPARTALLAVKNTIIAMLENVKGAEPVVSALKSIKDKPEQQQQQPQQQQPPEPQQQPPQEQQAAN